MNVELFFIVTQFSFLFAQHKVMRNIHSSKLQSCAELFLFLRFVVRRDGHFCAEHKLSTRIDGRDDIVFSLFHLRILAPKDNYRIHLPLKVFELELFAVLEQRLSRKPFFEKVDHTRSSLIVRDVE